MMPVNAEGHIEGYITIPEGIPSGTKQVIFTGNQGSYGETTYTSRGLITLEERRAVTLTSGRSSRIDPLAQTFTLKESRFIGGVDVWFTEKGARRVMIQIRETNLGMPTSKVLAEGFVTADQISLTTATRLTFSPIWCHADTEYAFVLLTDDPDHAVALAELGQYDSKQETWITTQPYQVGVLLSSSNAMTWTAHQEKDLAFRLLAAKFTETNHTIILEDKITVKDLTDLMILGNVERPTSETDIEFFLTESDGTEHQLSEDLPLALREKINGACVLKAHLKGNSKASPVLYPCLQAVCGTVSEEADYVTRTIPVSEASKVTVTYEAITPGTSSVKIYIQKGDVWELIELSKGIPVDHPWDERTHIRENFSGNAVKIKIVLTGTVLYRPKVRSLRVIIT